MGGQKSKTVLERTLHIYTWVIILIFSLLFIRIAWLQLIRAEDFRLQADSNTMRMIPETAGRGEITDRSGLVIVSNRPVFNLSLDYLSLDQLSTAEQDLSIRTLVEILQDTSITYETIKESIKAQRNRLFEPIIIKRDVPIELVTSIEERRRELTGISIDVQPQRSYPYGTLAGHLLGYVHSIKEELELPQFKDYGLGDLIGKTGLEKTYEQYLRGENGFRQMEVTAKNRPVREILTIPPVTGNKLVLTIDLKLQEAMEKSFDETLIKVQKEHPQAKSGGAVLLDVKTGKVLAMSSRPTLNPDDFNGKPLTQALADYYFRNLPPALYNRAIQGNYVPGSTFKPITGMAALETARMDPAKDYVTCTGRYWNPPFIKCWSVHGRVNYYSAMAGSCNVYFQEMARRAEITNIGNIGSDFGLGRPSGIDLPFESSGLLPNSDWQNKEFAQRSANINKRIDEKLAGLDNEYQGKIALTTDEREKRRLENELNSKKRSWEQQRKQELDHYAAWHEWDTYNTGIGQGYNQYTVIQLANYIATVANGGKLYTPYTVDKILAPDGSLVKEFVPQLVSQASVSPNTIIETQKAMLAVTAPGGTAYSLFKHFPANIKVGAKTGTAQPGRTGYGKTDYDGLFVAFAPADDPQIAFAGVIEFGWSGGGSIGLVAKAVFEEYFGVQPIQLNPNQAATDRPETGGNAGPATVESTDSSTGVVENE